MLLLPLVAVVLAVSPPSSPLSVPPVLQDRAKPLTPSSLAEEIDLSLRWLRGAQDATTGGYGNVAATTAVLLAFAESPRRYRAGDGPFLDRAVSFLLAHQTPEGAFTDADVPPSGERAQTLATLLALRAVGGERGREARARAAAYLQIAGDPPPPARPAGLAAAGADFLLDLAGEELARRHPLGFWEEKGERVHTTAAAVWRLAAIQAELAAREGPEAPGVEKPLPAFGPADRAAATRALVRGAEFLLSAAEGGRWGFGGEPDPGITGMVASALAAVPAPRPPHVQEALEGALDWLVSLQKPEGSIHAGQLHNYVTCAAVMALAAAGREKDRPVLEKARAWLRVLQADEGEGYAPGDRYFGGVGYGGDERPDLSNLQMALEALATGTEAENAATFRKALAFLQRCQNRSESNDLAITSDGVTIRSGEDGGAGYAPGESKAGFVELPDGTRVPRSYGSMSYALLKGYLFAGLPREDPRVEAAWRWILANWTLDVNPGFEADRDPAAAYQGLFYYFHTMARALDLYGEERIVDPRGASHAWRAELAGRLVSMQRPDGSWLNENSPRWYEGNPVLATAYAMSTLALTLGR
ncbi:MAG: prenyltransferase/squalene oxidase repeat-containing protein [Planctomycetota bacterium]